jgi:hypothetical protein
MAEDRRITSQQAVQQAINAQRAVVAEFMAPENLRQNVVGLGVGEKLREGRGTGQLALMALVTHKVPRDTLSEADLVPSNLQGMPTDVIEVGYPVALAGETQVMPAVRPAVRQRDGRFALIDTGYAPVEEAEPILVTPQVLTHRVRPAQGGYSVAHVRVTAGTIATGAYDILPGGSASPPRHGIGTPPKFYVLSNNHVLANSNAAAFGDPILQPGPIDGGRDPEDRIALLSRFIPITFEPPIPRPAHNNLVDAAIAEVSFQELEREIYWIGGVRGWRQKANVTVNTQVKKVGRTTNLTVGNITAIGATVDVSYGGGRVARFTDQIVTTNISAGGDSGSLVVTLDNIAVGLLFAGSAVATIINQIENVRALLRVEVAEQIL